MKKLWRKGLLIILGLWLAGSAGQGQSLPPNRMFVTNPATRNIDLRQDNKVVATRKAIWIKTKDGRMRTFPVALAGNRLTASLGPFGTYTELLADSGRVATGRITVQVTTNEPFIIQCPFEFAKSHPQPYFMIPGFLYGTNNLKTSDGQQPKFDYGGKIDWPNSSLFYVRADRSTHPGVLTVKDNAMLMVGIREKVDSIELVPTDQWSPGYLYNGLMLSSTDSEKQSRGTILGDIGWTGGMQVAYPLLKASLRLNDSLSRRVAMTYIDNLCAGEALNKKAGLLYEEYRDGKWEVTGWWGTRKDCFNFGDKPLHSAYLNGQAAYFLLKAYELTGRQHQRWLQTATTVLNTVLKGQRPDGSYPCFFDPNTGRGVNYDGFQSCWFVPGMVMLAKLTKNETYRQSAERAMPFYHHFHQKGELYGTPMDTHLATDEEGNLSFIVAAAELHKLTGQPKYLAMGLDGLHWEFSWKFPFNVAHTNEPLKSMNWSSSGASITSSHNVSIHQMGNLVAGDIYYLYTQTRNPYIASRLKDICIWGLGTYNTRDNDFGFGKTGQATEQFFYTDGLVLPWHKAWDGGIWEASLSWASACVLLSCAEDIPAQFFGE